MKKVLTVMLCMIAVVSMTKSQELQRSRGGDPQSVIEYVNSGLPLQSEAPAVPIKPMTPTRSISYYTDRAVFNAAHPGLPVEGFENSTVPDNNIWGIPHPLDATSSNAYFSPGAILPGIQFWASTNWGGDELAIIGQSYGGFPSKTIVANYFVDHFRVVFNPPVTAVGMDIQRFLTSGLCDIQIYGPSNNLLASAQSPGNQAGVFWGIASDDPIGEILIFAPDGDAEGADNIAFEVSSPPQVPLSNWALYLGIFLIVMFTAIRFRKMV